MKSIPKEDSEEYFPFFRQEEEKIRYGVTINGVYIHGWLYWYLNHWHIYLDVLDKKNNEANRAFANPQFRDNEWIIAEHLKKAEDEKKGLLVFGSRQVGKELLNSSKLYTESGYICIGDAKVDDKIFDDSGNLTTITGVFPQGNVPIYKMTLIDGRVIFCGLEHKWLVLNRYNGKKIIKTTKELILDYKRPRIKKGYEGKNPRIKHEYKYYIPNNKPINYKEKELRIDPYFLGIWLGDGASNSIGITNVDSPIIEYIKNYGKSFGLITRVNPSDKITYHLTSGIKGGNKKEFSNKNKLLKIFKELNLIKNKHIPEEFLYSSFEQRLSLLQGLMDTDGSCSDGSIEFTTTNKNLAENFYFLCRNLGIITTRKERDAFTYYKNKKSYGKRVFRFNLFTELPVFRLKRKLKNIKLGDKKRKLRQNFSAIINIEYVFDDLATCISVSNKKSLYLTDNFTVTHNTMMESSWIGRGATIYEGSQNVMSSTSSDDIRMLTAATSSGLQTVHPYFKFQQLKYNWDKEVTLGIEAKDGKKYEYSRILIRNLDGGKNTEGIAGTSPKTLVIDEIGKVEKILEAFVAAKPGFTSRFGWWRCMPLLTGTGGAFIPNSDAQKMFEEPEAHNFLALNWPGREKHYGLFMARKFRLEGKVPTNFGKFIQNTKGILLPEGSELADLEFFESDEKLANEITHKEIKDAEKSSDPKAALKARMYYPENPEDCFLSDTQNPFPIEAIQQHFLYLNSIESNGERVQLYRDETGKVKFSYNTKLKEITDFPVTPITIKDAPIIMYEPPCNDSPPHLLYIAGADPYNQNASDTSPSLGTVHIYKRMYDLVDGTFQNMIVASYAGRPREMREWHRIVEMLLELYNATCMIENAGTNFIEYMGNKHKSFYLADGYNLLKDISPTTSIKSKPKGLPPTVAVINHCMGLLMDYCYEEIIGVDNQDNAVKKLGVTRIKDKMLLVEMLNYQPKTNCDRIVSFRHALAYDSYLQKISPIVKYVELNDNQIPKRKPIQSPFPIRKPTMSRGIGRRSPF